VKRARQAVADPEVGQGSPCKALHLSVHVLEVAMSFTGSYMLEALLKCTQRESPTRRFVPHRHLRV